MAATDFVWGRIPLQGADMPYKNTSGAAITAGQVLKLDATNVIGATQPQVGMVLPSATTDVPDGFAVENVPIGGQGRVQTEGLAIGIASGAISAGASVMPAATLGQVSPWTASNAQAGKAWSTTTTAGDPILIRVNVNSNGH